MSQITDGVQYIFDIVKETLSQTFRESKIYFWDAHYATFRAEWTQINFSCTFLVGYSPHPKIIQTYNLDIQ